MLTSSVLKQVAESRSYLDSQLVPFDPRMTVYSISSYNTTYLRPSSNRIKDERKFCYRIQDLYTQSFCSIFSYVQCLRNQATPKSTKCWNLEDRYHGSQVCDIVVIVHPDASI